MRLARWLHDFLAGLSPAIAPAIAPAITLAVALAAATPPAAASECRIGGRDAPCRIKDGAYRMVKPDGPGPFPAVVWLYGSTGKSGEIMAQPQMVDAFLERGYAFIVPIARDVRYVGGLESGWSLRHSPATDPRDDVAFVQAVLRDAVARRVVRPREVLIMGQSRGAFLAMEIACHAPGTAAAYAPHAGGYLGPLPARCAGPARMLYTHGRADRVVPFRPDPPRLNGGMVMQPPETALARIAATNGCTSRAEAERFRDYDRIAWQGCQRGADTTLLVHNGGHGWPLSWISTVIDWFEGDRPDRPAAAGARATFKAVGEGDRFKSATGRAAGSGRFKRPATRGE